MFLKSNCIDCSSCITIVMAREKNETYLVFLANYPFLCHKFEDSLSPIRILKSYSLIQTSVLFYSLYEFQCLSLI